VCVCVATYACVVSLEPIKEATAYHQLVATLSLSQEREKETQRETEREALYTSWRRPSGRQAERAAQTGAARETERQKDRDRERRYSSSSIASSSTLEGRVTRRRGSEVVIKM
jgi:hypothetical protein